MSSICGELEKHTEKNETRSMFQKVCILPREFKVNKQQRIKNENDKVKTNAEEIAEVWRTYCAKLYKAGEDTINSGNIGKLKDLSDIKKRNEKYRPVK